MTPTARREYADRLEATSRAYATAADAPGLRKDAARFLFSESLRLHREAQMHYDLADDAEALATKPTGTILLTGSGWRLR